MALTDQQKQKIEAEAQRIGADPAEMVSLAEDEVGKSSESGTSSDSADAPAKPIADRLLIGFLPFIKVRELREQWLGLTERIPDDEMTCGDYQLKHGGTQSGGGGTPPDGGNPQ